MSRRHRLPRKNAVTTQGFRTGVPDERAERPKADEAGHDEGSPVEYVGHDGLPDLTGLYLAAQMSSLASGHGSSDSRVGGPRDARAKSPPYFHSAYCSDAGRFEQRHAHANDEHGKRPDIATAARGAPRGPSSAELSLTSLHRQSSMIPSEKPRSTGLTTLRTLEGPATDVKRPALQNSAPRQEPRPDHWPYPTISTDHC